MSSTMSGDPPASHSHAAAATLPLARRRRRHQSRPWRRRCRRAPEDLFILPEGDPVSDPPLNPRGPARGSLTVGPLGPLVRFDQSPPPPSSPGRTEAGLRRSTPANDGSSRGPEGGDGSTKPGRSSRWSRRWRGWRESPAASSAADGSFGRFGALAYGGSPTQLRVWAAPHGRGEEDGGAIRTGGGLWLRLNGPEGGGGCTGRRWGRWPPAVDCWLWGP